MSLVLVLLRPAVLLNLATALACLVLVVLDLLFGVCVLFVFFV